MEKMENNENDEDKNKKSKLLANKIRTKLLLDIDKELRINIKSSSTNIKINSFSPSQIRKKYSQKTVFIVETILYSSKSDEINEFLISNFYQNIKPDSKDEIQSPTQFEDVDLMNIKLSKKINIGERKLELQKLKSEKNANQSSKDIQQKFNKADINLKRPSNKRHKSTNEIQKVIEEFGEGSEKKIESIKKLWKICKQAKKKYIKKKKHSKIILQEHLSKQSSKTKIKRKSSMFMKENKLEQKIFNNDKINDSPVRLKRAIRKSVSLKGDQILQFIKNSKKKLNLVEKEKSSPIKRLKSPKRSKKKLTHKDLFNNLKENKEQKENFEIFATPRNSNRTSIDSNYFNNNYPISENKMKTGCIKSYISNFMLKKQLSSIIEEKDKDKEDVKKDDNEILSSPRKCKKNGKIPKTAGERKKDSKINDEKKKSIANNNKMTEVKIKKRKKINKDKIELDNSSMDNFFNKKQQSNCEVKLFHNALCKKKMKNTCRNNFILNGTDIYKNSDGVNRKKISKMKSK